MKIRKVKASNFRGIKNAEISFEGHTVLIGDNNAGKSTILEAIDLVLGPDRLSRLPVIDEHDFYNGVYINEDNNPIPIEIEIIIGDLSIDQKRKFSNNLEFWDINNRLLIESPPVEQLEQDNIEEVIRVAFNGRYDAEDDDFIGETFFCSPVDIKTKFHKSDKRDCGFLYLRALRTGTRALSLERGSLLDIILRIQELRPQMWENVLNQLRETEVKSGDDDEVNKILSKVQSALQEFVPTDWGSDPHLKVSNLTREHLRKTLVVFMSTGSDGYFVPFNHQGTGTINTMVLALLSMIAELKQSVIFAMEEPEIAIPPYTQKRIINSIRGKSAQAIFTSHSPFVLEEFDPKNIVLIQRDKGIMKGSHITFPSTIKPKAYSKEFRMRFAESLLAKRILITEGSTEASAYSAAARRLSEIDPGNYMSFEAMGLAIFNAESETSIPIFGDFFLGLGKKTFAVFDKQSSVDKLQKIQNAVPHCYESEHPGFERLIIEETDREILLNYAEELSWFGDWPQHIAIAADVRGMNEKDFNDAIFTYLTWQKAAGSAAEIISLCDIKQMPETLKNHVKAITNIIQGENGVM
ncbi:MAG TPA: AAA family ATPase [Sphingobacteriaceae bacterium]